MRLRRRVPPGPKIRGVGICRTGQARRCPGLGLIDHEAPCTRGSPATARLPVLAVILGDAATQGRALSGTALLFVYAVGHCLSMLVAGTSGGVVEFFAGRTGSPIGRLGRDGSAACWTPW